MNGKRIFRKFSFFTHAVVWQAALVSIVTVALVNGAISTAGGGMIA
jgi:hypothetical protein